MPVSNAAIARSLEEVADLLELEGANPFRVRAYRGAARTVSGLSQNLSAMIAAGEDLAELPGIGADLAGKIAVIVDSGSLPLLDELRARTPPALAKLLGVPGMGPKRVRQLNAVLKVESLEDLRRAAAEGRIRDVPGFGEKTEANILSELTQGLVEEKRFLLAEVEELAGHLVAALSAVPGTREVVVAGSFRRRKETVGDLDVLAVAGDGAGLMERFTTLPDVARVLAHGETKSSVRLKNDLQVDLRVVPAESFGAALHYFTGSKAHNIAIRRMGQKQGLKVNEYGVFRGEEQIAGADEAGIYALFGLPEIPPELREDRGEIAAAANQTLPELITVSDLRGDLHVHSSDSDGRSSPAELAAAAQALGYAYLAVTDHSKRLGVARGLDAKRLRAQIRAIDDLNGALSGIVLLKGCEVDILEDGSLDLPDDVLGELDVVVAAVHSRFDLGPQQQTERFIRAMDRRCVNILAHPTGRLIGRRKPCELDLEKLFAAARERGVALELNAQPARLDLPDIHCQAAREAGVVIAIGSDAHAAGRLGDIRHGLDQARRGWLAAADVLNTRPLTELKRFLAR